MEDEYLTKCVVDTCTRNFIVYSNLGTTKKIQCETVDEFTNVLSYLRDIFSDGKIEAELVYADPIVK